MILNVIPINIEAYSSWLISQKYQINTVRNYLLDLKIFLEQSSNVLSPDSITNFIANDSKQNNHSRHLASISKFCQFTVDQQLISENPFVIAKKNIKKQNITYDLNLLLTQFAQSLAREGKTSSTIKNYLGDIHQYIHFCESQTL